ncbi:MAG: L-aspartate oxidase [Pseudomonadota bacterium]
MTHPTVEIIKTDGGSGPDTGVLIIGAGLAGLFLALKLSPRPCTIISPAPLGTASSSAWAQGGLAAALDPADSPDAHAKDTVAAGAGLVDPSIAKLIAEDGPDRVLDLIELGVPFDRTPEGALALSLEAAHSAPRVARVAGDLAGRAIMDALTIAVEKTDSITIRTGLRATGLLQTDDRRVAGVALTNNEGTHTSITADETVLCTGGSGGLFEVTTNPASALGDALAMAADCGALLSDTEFVQFHPTALDINQDPAPLATEALRGEGAILIDSAGKPFMAQYHELAELAPRDEVARAIQAERLSGRGAFLDARTAVGAKFPEHFPTVFNACQSVNIDPRLDPMPVATAAHYHMGGIVSDLWGRTNLDGLSVCGECASTGAHGANRLASNSLLEAVVFAERISRQLRETHGAASKPAVARIYQPLTEVIRQTLRTKMATQCGVIRSADGLTDLLNWISQTEETFGPARPLLAAKLIAAAALDRKESRGGHHRTDYPQTDDPQRTFIKHLDGRIEIERMSI